MKKLPKIFNRRVPSVLAGLVLCSTFLFYGSLYGDRINRIEVIERQSIAHDFNSSSIDHFIMGKYSLALKEGNTAIAMYPEEPIFKINLSDSYLVYWAQVGELLNLNRREITDLAYRLNKEAFELAPNSEAVVFALATTNMVYIFVHGEDKWLEAATMYRRLNKMRHNEHWIRLEARCWFEAGFPNLARVALDKSKIYFTDPQSLELKKSIGDQIKARNELKKN